MATLTPETRNSVTLTPVSRNVVTLTPESRNSVTLTASSKNAVTLTAESRSLPNAPVATGGLYRGFGAFTYFGNEVLAQPTTTVFTAQARN